MQNNIEHRINYAVLESVSELLSPQPQKWVISKYSAAALWGFSNMLTGKIDVTFPKGEKSSKITRLNGYFSVHTRIGEKYEKGKIQLKFNNNVVWVYDPERTIVEIIKDNENTVNDIVVDTIKLFAKKINYDKAKIIEYAKLLNIESTVSYIFEVI